MSFLGALEIRRDLRLMIRRANKRSVFDAVAANMVTNSGPYDPNLTPYMREPTDALASRRHRVVCFVGPGRTGKTNALIDGWIARNATDDPADMLVVQSTQDLARDYSKFRIDRMIDASPVVGERMSHKRQDNNTYDKVFKPGVRLSFGWPSGAQAAGRDFRFVAVTELDKADDDIEGEGSLFALFLKRIQTYLSAGKMMVESSVRRTYMDSSWRRTVQHELPPATGITAIYNSGTMKWFHWRCMHCGAWTALDPDVHVMFDLPPLAQLADDLVGVDAAQWARDHARVCCKSCGVEFDEAFKRELNGRGRWLPSGCQFVGDDIVGEVRDSTIDSYMLSCVAAAYQSWQEILYKYAIAIQDYARTGLESEIKSTVNLDQGRAYLPLHAGQRRSLDGDTSETRENLPQGMVPHGVRFMTAQVDVQAGKRRGFVVQVIGWGRDREHWIIDRYMLRHSTRPDADGDPLPIDPAGYVEDWDRLTEKCIERKYPLADGSGRVMAVRLTVCDSGGEDGVTRRAYEFHRRLVAKQKDRRFRLVKGRDNGPQQHEAYPDTSGRVDRNSGSAGDVPVLLLNANLLKDTLAADLERQSPGPGYWHLPQWMDDAHVRELTSEVRTVKGWRKPSNSTKNESIDLCCYGEAAYLRLKADQIDWHNPPSWAAEWDRNSEITMGSSEPRPIVRQRPRVTRSKYLGN